MSRVALVFEPNQQFGRLTVISKHTLKSKAGKWWCICKCGSKVLIDGAALKSGNNKSCGCLNNRPNKNVTTSE